MSYQVITDFRQGLDARKFKLALPPGALLECNNAHITQGGEIEKRKAFVPLVIPAVYTGKQFGMQPAANGIYIFGSQIVSPATATRDRFANVARLKLPNAAGFFAPGDVVNITGLGGVGYNGNGIVITAITDSTGDQYISYASVNPNEALNTIDDGGVVIKQSAVLPAPLIYELLVYPGAVGGSVGWQTYKDLTGVVSSTVFSGVPFVIGQFAAGTFLYYGPGETYVWNGSGFMVISVVAGASRVVQDSFAGLQITSTLYGGNGTPGLIDNVATGAIASGSYTASVVGAVLDIFSIPTTLNGTPYTVSVSVQSAAGTMVAAQQTTGQASTAAAQAVGSLQITSAGAGTQATGTISDTAAANMNDGDTLTVGATVYRFKTVMAQAYDVKIGGTRVITLASFAAAINGTGVAGTDYFAGTVAHPTVRCTALNTTTGVFTMSLAAITGGTAGNAIALASTASTRLVVSAATLTGGVDSKINQVVVNGATNLLAAAVAFTVDEATTAAAVAEGINAHPASGYQATSNGSTVNILAQVAGVASNGFAIQVQAQGTIVCGTGAFSITGSGFTFDFCKANGVDLMNDAILLANEAVMTYPQVPNQVLSDFCRAVANNINSGTATHGYLAHCPQGSVSIYLCLATTTSTDKQQVLDVSVTPTTGTGAAIPVTVTPLSVSLDTNAVAIGVGGKSGSVTATVQGGVSPFVYKWTQQGTNAIGIHANSPKAAQTTFSSATNSTINGQLKTYNALQSGAAKANYLASHPALAAFLQATQVNQVAFVCVVTDALGEQATSDAVYITLLGQ